MTGTPFTISTIALAMATACFFSSSQLSAQMPTSDTELHLDWRDTSVQPADNFYAYANGTWQKANPIPPEFSLWGSFSLIAEKTRKTVHELIQEAASKKGKEGTIEQKVGDFYYSGMDEATIDRLGAQPLEQEFQAIAAIKTQSDLQAQLPMLHLIGVDSLFSLGSMTDFKNSKWTIGAIGQGGLSLPDRDYYLKEEPSFQKIRQEFIQHMIRMFALLGDEPATAQKQADIIMSIETRLAKASMSQIEQRDPKAIYNMKSLQELESLTPNIDWKAYLKAVGLPSLQRINVAMPLFFTELNAALQTIPIEEWKIYLRWHLIDSFAPYLSKPFVEEDFKMSTVLYGTKKLQPRWKRIVSHENGALGFAIGKLYVEKYFSEKSKQDATEMLVMIKKTLRKDLETLAWMSPETRAAAIKKLDLMQERVGFPDKWRDYSSLKIDRGPYVRNVIRADIFLSHYDLNKIEKPVDRNEWDMTPQTINAYYDPTMNNINLPAAILQPPFYSDKAPAAMNYGAIGFVAAHEMTHGFDDSGAQFDGYGNLKNWWTQEDLKKFKAATDCIAEQFSTYKVEGNMAVQGKLVVGEAVADLGGLTLAYRAFQASPAYKTAKTINGLTPDQQFFLSSAHVWAGNIRKEAQQNLITTDSHPPMIYRVNGTLANMPAFAKAFGIKSPSEMVAVKRCVIW